jgi:hypothetical protein
LFDEMLDLPELTSRYRFPFPKLLPPELEILRSAIDADDLDAIDEHLGGALRRFDHPVQRAWLARAVLVLTENGAIDAAVANTAIVHLDSHGTSSLLRISLLHALTVSVDASPTPAGLLVVSH